MYRIIGEIYLLLVIKSVGIKEDSQHKLNRTSLQLTSEAREKTEIFHDIHYTTLTTGPA